MGSFSILSRIDLTATPKPRETKGGGTTFSILSRIDLTATARTSAPPLSNSLFQYPLPDRPHCNTMYEFKAVCPYCFQYPLPDRPHCNDLRRIVLYRVDLLSVSSPGSTSLQRRCSFCTHPSGAAFSILSRIDLTATWPWSGDGRRCETFSILSRIDLTATLP